jgi:DnaJ like chaperone protein
MADNILKPSEEEFLKDVARRFGIDNEQFRSIRSRHVISNDVNPYDVLEISSSVSNAELKRQYHKLVIHHHPDRLIARGVPEEFVEIANKRLAAINAAWEQIKRQRGI